VGRACECAKVGAQTQGTQARCSPHAPTQNRGVGAKTAALIVAGLGADRALATLDSPGAVEALRGIRGIGASKAAAIKAAWDDSRGGRGFFWGGGEMRVGPPCLRGSVRTLHTGRPCSGAPSIAPPRPRSPLCSPPQRRAARWLFSSPWGCPPASRTARQRSTAPTPRRRSGTCRGGKGGCGVGLGAPDAALRPRSAERGAMS
jgi:hypothetical protein